jgi:peptidyl-prolyl cis-trans isomerase B (cyclophilin B)
LRYIFNFIKKFPQIIFLFFIQFLSSCSQLPIDNNDIKNEADNGLKNKTYTIAMARTPAPDSASSQFFINIADNDFLNFTSPTSQGWGYCVFGKVVNGIDVVDAIGRLKTKPKSMFTDMPAEEVVIEKAEVI